MRAGLLFPAGILVCILAAGCIQIPGHSWMASSPDPVVGQWIGGEPPQTDFHMIFFENQTYLYSTYYLKRGEQIEQGTWTKTGPGRYTAQSRTGNATIWVYDSSDDSLYINGMPLFRYTRYKG
ncbi:MAG: hypothetical protein LUQ31_03390 [Methanoregula sp.]|nr:hypothetical protein [Methanoregula sp.]